MFPVLSVNFTNGNAKSSNTKVPITPKMNIIFLKNKNAISTFLQSFSARYSEIIREIEEGIPVVAKAYIGK